MKNIRLLISLLFALAIVFSSMAIDYDFSYCGFLYKINSGGRSVTVVGGAETASSYEIPSIAIEYIKDSQGEVIGSHSYTVTSIAAYAFRYSRGVKLTIPNSVTTIEPNAFYNSQFYYIILPDSITSIGKSAFSYSKNLYSITIPNGITSISEQMFYDCSNLRSVSIPKSVTTIGEHAFAGCTYLGSVSIPQGVTKIGSYAFSYCEKLTNYRYTQ